MTEYQIGAIIGALVTGLIIGLIYFLIAMKKGKRRLGIFGLVACTIANFALGLLLSIPTFLVFIVVLALSKKEIKTSQTT